MLKIIFCSLLLLIIILVLVKNYTREVNKGEKSIYDIYNNINIIKNGLSDNQLEGGVLIHMFALEDMINLDNEKKFKFNLQTSGTADCGGSSLKACSAWTYLRKDIPPLIFTFPTGGSMKNDKTADSMWKSIVGTDRDGNALKKTSGGLWDYWTPNVAVILDAKKAWPLITTMGIIDSATDDRNCLSSARPGGFPNPNDNNSYELKPGAVYHPKLSKSVVWPHNTKIKLGVGVFAGPDNMGSNCATNCNELNSKKKLNTVQTNYCKYRVSGGSLNKSYWRNKEYSDKWGWVLNDSIHENDVQNFNTGELSEKNKKTMKSLKYDTEKLKKFNPGKNASFRNPFICVTEKTPFNKNLKNDILMNTNNKNSADDAIYNYIGSNSVDGYNIEQRKKDDNNNGKTFKEQYFNNNGYPIGSLSIQVSQCKFEKKDFNRWIYELKSFWYEVFKTLRPNNKYIIPNHYPGQNELSANPFVGWQYFENEVNMFIDPNINNDDDIYNKIYRNSIIGFGYYNKTIDEQLYEVPVNNSIPVYGNFWSSDKEKYTKYKNINDRVIGVSTGGDNNKGGPGYLMWHSDKNTTASVEEVKKYEKARLKRGSEVMKNIKNKFNKKYNRNISLYELNTFSPILQNYNLLDKIFNKGGIDGREILIKKD